MAVFAGALGLVVPAASAASVPAVTASTQLTNRADSGGNGNWATGTMTRRLVITQTGKNRQHPLLHRHRHRHRPLHRHPARLHPEPGRRGPRAEDRRTAVGHPSGGPKTTSNWYEQAFPAGTTFGGAGITTWGWNYTATAATFLRGGGFN
ncbi:MAG: hypothetical protein M3Y33_14415, partial [Actinomycetota bacterium]|nr:hypothetical protein [Actinomycetota bacterium]